MLVYRISTWGSPCKINIILHLAAVGFGSLFGWMPKLGACTGFKKLGMIGWAEPHFSIFLFFYEKNASVMNFFALPYSILPHSTRSVEGFLKKTAIACPS